MKFLAGFTIVSLVGAYVAPRFPIRNRNVNWIDEEEEHHGRLAKANKLVSLFDGGVSSDKFVSLSKLEEEKSDPSETDSAYAEIMKEVEAKLDAVTDQAIKQLKSILMLDDSSDVSEGLLEKIAEFQKKLTIDLESDLIDVVESFKSSRSSDGPLSDEESYEFLELLKTRWEGTLVKDLEEFQKSILPKWVSSVRDVWKGLEKKVMDRIEKFKQYVHKTSPRSSDTCELPRPVLLGTDAISKASKSLNPSGVSLASNWGTAGKVALFILAVSGVICLALAAPFWFYFLGTFYVFEWLIAKIFYR
jgi:hypothetical protein